MFAVHREWPSFLIEEKLTLVTGANHFNQLVIDDYSNELQNTFYKNTLDIS